MVRAVVPVSVLYGKKEAELSGGAFTKDDEVAVANRSKYNTRPAAARCALGMGVVQGLLAVLSGHVTSFTWQERGRIGIAQLRSTKRQATTYEFSWNVDDPSTDLYGGFKHSDGGPTYQLAVLSLIVNFLDLRFGGSARSDEVMGRWFDLVDVMDGFSPRGAGSDWWSPATVASACWNAAFRDHIERVVDAMWFTMRYELPDTALDRTVEVDDMHVVLMPLSAPAGTLRGTGLFVRPGATPSARAAASVPVVSGAPTVIAQNGLVGAMVERVAFSLDCGRGPVMLVGPQGLGKSTIPMQHAIDRGWRLEPCTLHPGWEGVDLFGEPVQVLGEETFVPGPVTRWAQLVLESLSVGRGQVIMLLIEEYTRGHKSVQAALMAIMNQYHAGQVRAMGLAVPEGESGPFYIVEVKDLQRRYVLPRRLARIVVTANVGASFRLDLSLDDPALRSRFRGGWFHFGDYTDTEAAQILALNLRAFASGLSAQASLIQAMLDVAAEVKRYQKGVDSTHSRLDPRTLLSWGESIFDHLQMGGRRVDLPEAFLEAALETWIDMFCPLDGDDLDANARGDLMALVTARAPSAIL